MFGHEHGVPRLAHYLHAVMLGVDLLRPSEERDSPVRSAERIRGTCVVERLGASYSQKAARSYVPPVPHEPGGVTTVTAPTP